MWTRCVVPGIYSPAVSLWLVPEFQLMRLCAHLESHFLIVGFTRVPTFVTWDSYELTHNLTGSHAQTLPPGRGEH